MGMTKKEWLFGLTTYVFVALFLIYEMAVQVSPSVMTKQLMRSFGIGAGELGWMASVYFYSYTLMQIPAGLLYDRIGLRRLLSIAAASCAFGILFFSFTNSVYPAAFGRFLMGLGSSFAFIGVVVVAARWFDRKHFPVLVGITQFLGMLGAMCGAVPIAKGVEVLGWRALMWILMSVGFILALSYFFFLKEHPSHEFADGTDRDHSVLSHVKQVTKKGQTWICGLYAFLGWGPMVMFAALWGVPYISKRFGVDASTAALATSLMWLGCGVGSPMHGWISEKIGRRKPMLMIGALLGALSFSMILYLPVNFLGACILLFLAGVACAAHVLTFSIARENNPEYLVGASVGFNNMSVVLGGAILQPVGGYILNFYDSVAVMVNGVYSYPVEAYTASLSIIPLLYIMGFCVSLFLVKETYCKRSV